MGSSSLGWALLSTGAFGGRGAGEGAAGAGGSAMLPDTCTSGGGAAVRTRVRRISSAPAAAMTATSSNAPASSNDPRRRADFCATRVADLPPSTASDERVVERAALVPLELAEEISELARRIGRLSRDVQDRLAHVRRRGEAIVTVALAGTQDDRRQLARHRRRQRRRHDRSVARRVLPRQHLVEHDAERVDVGARVDRLRAHLLGRHVAELALEPLRRADHRDPARRPPSRRRSRSASPRLPTTPECSPARRRDG